MFLFVESKGFEKTKANCELVVFPEIRVGVWSFTDFVSKFIFSGIGCQSGWWALIRSVMKMSGECRPLRQAYFEMPPTDRGTSIVLRKFLFTTPSCTVALGHPVHPVVKIAVERVLLLLLKPLWEYSIKSTFMEMDIDNRSSKLSMEYLCCIPLSKTSWCRALKIARTWLASHLICALEPSQ